MRVGALEIERTQMVAALAKGKSFEEATAPFRTTIEPAWFERNEDELLMLAGKKTKRAANAEERQAAAVLLKQKDAQDQPVYPTVESLARVFPAVDVKTLDPKFDPKAQK